MFKDRTCGLLAAAAANLQDAQLDYAVGSCSMGINRRRLSPKGKAIGMLPEPRKPIDMDVPILRAISPTGQVRAIAFGYACHPSTLSSLEVSADFPLFARASIAEAFPGCTPLFLQGCGGDIKARSILPNGRFGYKSSDVVAELGHELGRAVLAALCAPPLPPAPRLSGITEIVQLPGKKGPKTSVPVEVQVLRIGDLYIIGMNGEVCVEIGLRIKHELSGMRVWVNGYTNLRVSYIPAAASFPEEGYEVKISPVTAEAEDILVNGARRATKAMQSQ
jgi:hypothetical protein